MRTSLLAYAAVLISVPAFAQPVIGGIGYSSPIPFPVAPGQLITLFVQGISAQLTGPVRAFTNP